MMFFSIINKNLIVKIMYDLEEISRMIKIGKEGQVEEILTKVSSLKKYSHLHDKVS